MKCKHYFTKILIICIVSSVLTGCSKTDPELNEDTINYLYETSTDNKKSKYLDIYRGKFANTDVDGYKDYTPQLVMGLHWFIEDYIEAYSGKDKYFYGNGFDTPSISTLKLLNLYNTDTEKYYYLKPYLDCYLLMDKDSIVADEELATIKETILYAIDFYVNGVDYVENN